MEREEKKILEYENPTAGFGRLGAAKDGDGMTFAAELKPGDKAGVVFYEKGRQEIFAEVPFPGEHLLGAVAAVRVRKISPSRYEYNFRVNGQIVPDPYAKILRGCAAFGEEPESDLRCALPVGHYDWEGDKRPLHRYEDLIVYGLHVRGFTRQKQSGVRHKGTFLGVAEKADYLNSLGVNAVRLMPAYAFQETEILPAEPGGRHTRLNFWGYTRACHFAPKPAYAATEDAVREFRDMVKTLHRRGIEVLMEFYFLPETDTRYIVDCLQYWVETYHVDGFHLVDDHGLCRLLVKDPVFAGTKFLCGSVPGDEWYGQRTRPAFRTAAECSERFLVTARRLLKGDEDCLREFVHVMRRDPPTNAVMNYISAHDGFTLCDLVSYEERHNEENGERNLDGREQNFSWNCGEEGKTKKRTIKDLRAKQMRNAFCMMLFSSGTPLLLAGDEMENSQNGNNNPYCLDNEISWVDWKGYRGGKGRLWQFVRDLIAFRNEHPILHMGREFSLSDTRSCGFPDLSYHGDSAWYAPLDGPCRQIGMLYCGFYAGEDDFLYIAYNLHWTEHRFAIPCIPKDYQWHRILDTEKGFDPEQPLLADDRYVTVGARSIQLLLGRKETYVEKGMGTLSDNHKA